MTRQALDLNSSDWRAWCNLGLAYEWMNRRDDANQAFRRELNRLEEIAKAGGDDAEVQVERGLLHSRWNERRQALPLIKAALARGGEDPSILASASEAYENLGERDRALELVTRALNRGWTLAQLENDPGQRALIRDPRFRDVAKQANNNTLQPR